MGLDELIGGVSQGDLTAANSNRQRILQVNQAPGSVRQSILPANQVFRLKVRGNDDDPIMALFRCCCLSFAAMGFYCNR